MEAYVTLDGELDDITFDADERMVEIAADNRIRIGRNDCYRNMPAFRDGTLYVEYEFEAFTLDSGDVVYTSSFRGMVSSALLVDVNQFERDPDYPGFQSDLLTVYALPGYYGVNNPFDWRISALENVQALMSRFADDWGNSRRY